MSKVSSGISSLFKIAQNMVTNVDQYVTKELADERLKVCLGCPRYFEATGNCKECGCFCSFKVKFKQEECPLKKWSKDENDNQISN